MSDLRQKMETKLIALTGDLASAVQKLGDDAWHIVQLLPQPDGSIVALCQRPQLAVITDLSSSPLKVT